MFFSSLIDHKEVIMFQKLVYNDLLYFLKDIKFATPAFGSCDLCGYGEQDNVIIQSTNPVNHQGTKS